MIIICLVIILVLTYLIDSILKKLYSFTFLVIKANICSMIGYYIPYQYIVRVATLERSIPKNQAVYLLSAIGKKNSRV